MGWDLAHIPILIRVKAIKSVVEKGDVKVSIVSIVSMTRDALWFGTDKNRDVSTGPLARPYARSLAPLTHFAHSLARGTANY